MAVRELLIRWRLPLNVLQAIEAEQTEFRSKPEKTVGRLSNRIDRTFRKAVPDLPRCMRVLADVQRWIQCKRSGATGQQNGKPEQLEHTNV
jgi:HD-like signal output (HDOD) protein